MHAQGSNTLVSAALVTLLPRMLPPLLPRCSEVAERLCQDASQQVRVPALASLGQLLPLLPAAAVLHHHLMHKSPLLSLFASCAKPPAAVGAAKVASQLRAPRLSSTAAARQRKRQPDASQLQAAVQQQQPQEAPADAAGLSDGGSAGSVGDPQAAAAAATAGDAQGTAAAGSAAVELPLACAFHLGKVSSRACAQLPLMAAWVAVERSGTHTRWRATRAVCLHACRWLTTWARPAGRSCSQHSWSLPHSR